MYRVAIGFCGMTASEFNAMTPLEMEWRMRADMEREDRQLERTARLAMWLLQPHTKKQLRMKDFIKPRMVE